MRIRGCVAIIVSLVLAAGSGGTHGQGPPLEDTTPRILGGMRPSLGAPPGSGATSMLGPVPGSGDRPDIQPLPAGFIGNRPGPATPRVPFSVTIPGGGYAAPGQGGLSPTSELPQALVPAYGPLEMPLEGEDEGPADGLTLDQAIERLVQANPTLRGQVHELPQARADVLTAGLRANPIFYADAQLVPYGNNSPQRPGGPTQYDVNITYPLDISGKRWARVRYATQVLRTLEAQYQDAARLQIDNLYTAFVDILAARETVRFARASVAGLERVLELTEDLFRQGTVTEADVNRVRSQTVAASIALNDAEGALRRTKRTLSALLDIPPKQAMAIEPRGTLRDTIPAIPSTDQLVELALTARPDLAAYRIGLQAAHANVRLAQANRYSDVYVLYQPYTFQDNSPFGTKSATSWALGVTVPLPLYNRNQGNIQRARLNVSQTRAENYALERQVVTDVEQAESEYQVTRSALGRIESELLPEARQVRDSVLRLYRGGEVDALAYLNAQRDYNEVVRQYRDMLVRHRRSMLDLNTTVGHRVLP